MSLLFDSNLFQQVSYYDPAIHLRLKKKAQIYITAAVVDIAYNDEGSTNKKVWELHASGVKWYLLYTQSTHGYDSTALLIAWSLAIV